MNIPVLYYNTGYYVGNVKLCNIAFKAIIYRIFSNLILVVNAK